MDTEKFLKPTESEMEILQVIWDKGQASVRDVHESLLAHKDIGYTTTLKLMQIMFEKGLLTRDDSSRTHIYKPALSQEKAQKHLISKMINTLFSGSPANLVLQVLGNHKTSEDELKKIEHLLEQIKQQQ
ncbi:MAG: BlaI/MecI/CopY family transcriptional regulator [Dinghuibacter sp.]|nr:BlaI/MecI/CopY family transcriptional regulator [Dinghuibacter sp.]